MRVPIRLSQRGKYVHRAYAPDGKLLGIVNAADSRDLPTSRGPGRPTIIWYAQGLDGHRHGPLPDLEGAVRALVEHRPRRAPLPA